MNAKEREREESCPSLHAWQALLINWAGPTDQLAGGKFLVGGSLLVIAVALALKMGRARRWRKLRDEGREGGQGGVALQDVGHWA